MTPWTSTVWSGKDTIKVAREKEKEKTKERAKESSIQKESLQEKVLGISMDRKETKVVRSQKEREKIPKEKEKRQENVTTVAKLDT